MDPALQELTTGPEDDLLEVIVKLAEAQSPPPGLRIIARFGPVATGRLRRGDIQRVWAHPAVLSLKAPRLLEFARGPAAPAAVRQQDVRRPAVPERGRGVVVGVIDWGLDVASPAFRHASGATRLSGLWDQRELPGAIGQTSYGYGRIFDAAAIDQALASGDPYAALAYHPADSDTGDGSHGTHVMDIAAGGGGHGGPEGMAPEAELVFVHLAAGALGGLANLGDSVRILEALDFVRSRAGGRPFVVNLSVGRHSGPHTGGTLLEQAIDALVAEAPGRAVVMSTGNYYRAEAHASGRLTPGRDATLTWLISSADPTVNELEVWYREIDRFHVILEGPGGAPRLEASLGQNHAVLLGGREIGRLYHRGHDPNTPDHHVNLFLYPGAPDGAWRITLVPVEVRDGRWHAWVERDAVCTGCQSRFAPTDVEPTHTTGSICNGLLSIAVGALDTTGPEPRVAGFSSSGPTRDGRQKPDVIAPGVAILAARSTPRQGAAAALVRKSGASQAAPYVAGATALLFEAAGRPLTIHETRAIVLGSARPLAGAHDPLRTGAGVIDVGAALAAARRLSGPTTAVSTSTQEQIMTSTFNPASARESCACGESLTFPTQEAVRLFDRVYLGQGLGPGYLESFDLVAGPGETPEFLRAGDVLIQRPLAGRGADIRVLAENLPAAYLGAPACDRIVLRLREQAPSYENIGALIGRAAGGVGAAGGLASGVGDILGTLDKSVDIFNKYVNNGAYRFETDDARATPFSRNLAPRSPFNVSVAYTLVGHHPAPFVSNPEFVFHVDVEADCLNIYSVQIRPNYGASSIVISSDMRLKFRPVSQQPPGQPIAVIDYGIDGHWDPAGFGHEAFSGTLRVRANGNLSLTINSPQDWVYQKPSRVLRAAPVTCPAPTAPSTAATPPAQITPPDGSGARGGGGYGGQTRPSSSTSNLIHLLEPPGPDVVHVFFTTSATRLPDNELNSLQTWFNQLSPVVQEQIRTGVLPVYVTGHASPSGTYDSNMAISYRRAEAAKAALAAVVGPQALIMAQGVSSRDAVGAPGSNDQADRRATIRIQRAGSL